MQSPHADQKYIDALINGNDALLEEAYRLFLPEIKWMVVQNNGSEQDAADIFQEAIVDIYRKAKKGFTLTCPLGAFLYLICRNRWISELNRRKKNTVTFTDAERYNQIGQDSFAEAEQLQNSQQKRELLRRKISEMGESCRKLLELSLNGKDLQEVAAIMNTTYAYIRKKKSECVMKLTELMKKSPDYKLVLQ